MTSNYWAKIWIEMLDDPKVGMMRDRLWRRFVELILIAKEVDEDGKLPTVHTMAWRLHMSETQLQREVDYLEQRGKTEDSPGLLGLGEDGCWFVTRFPERQVKAENANAERVRRYRARRAAQMKLDEALQVTLPSNAKSNVDTESEEAVTNTDAQTYARDNNSPPPQRQPETRKRRTIMVPEEIKEDTRWKVMEAVGIKTDPALEIIGSGASLQLILAELERCYTPASRIRKPAVIAPMNLLNGDRPGAEFFDTYDHIPAAILEAAGLNQRGITADYF